MENFIVSARKYRPSTFATVVGQAAITNTLKNAIRNQQIAQAFLFTGPRGVGKTTCARILAKTINCTNITAEGEACNACPSCETFNKNSSFNVFELDAASNNSVDDIRNLVDQVRIPPQNGYKVYVIDEVHMLSAQAFNAFLKTLEEPPAYAKFILATTEKHKILPTILSRCQIFDFRRISVDDIAKHLEFVAKSENIEAEPEALHIIAQKADGGLRDALSMFDQLVSYAGDKLTYRQVIENLNVLDYEYYFKITDSILNGDISNTLLIINEIIDNGFEGQHFVTGLGQHLRNLLVSKDAITLQLLETSNSIKEQYYNQAQRCSVGFLMQALDIVNECDINYKTSNNKKLHIEITLMQMCKISMPADPADVRKQAVSSPVVSPAQPVKSPQSQQAKPSSAIPTPPPASVKAQVENAGPGQPEQKQPETANAVKPGQTPSSATKPIKETPSLSGLNLGNLMTGKKPEVKNQNNENEEEVPGESFGNEHVAISDVLRVWPKMISTLTNELPLLQHTLASKDPDFSDSTIYISIENTLQDEEVFRNKAEITRFLRKELKNDSIRIETVMVEIATENRRPYTDNEKFDYLAAKAPALKIMKDQLGLELDL